MLNLLPSQQKKEIRSDILNQVIISIAIAVIFMILILAPLFLVAKSFLNMNLDETERRLDFWQSKPEIKELKTLEEELKVLNKNTVFLDRCLEEQVEFSIILEDLANNMPSGLRFNNVSINEAHEISIKGYASTREILLVFKNTLENASYVNDLKFPLSNLTKATAINFYLSFQLENYEP